MAGSSESTAPPVRAAPGDLDAYAHPGDQSWLDERRTYLRY